MSERIACTAALWRWISPDGPAAWHFVSIGGAAGEALSATALMRKLEGSARFRLAQGHCGDWRERAGAAPVAV